MLDEATLVRHLGEMGWDAKPHGARTWRSVRKTDAGEVTVFVRLTDHWLIGSIVPFLQTRGQNSFELCRWLLRQNLDMPQLKFGIDDDVCTGDRFHARGTIGYRGVERLAGGDRQCVCRWCYGRNASR